MVYSSILKIIYTIIIVYDLEIEIFNIVAIYLNANIFENIIIFIYQPRKLNDGTDRTCRLKKALYSLHSSSKW